MSEEEIKQILEQSAQNAKKDAEYKQHVENATRVDILCTDAENVIVQFGNLMDEEDKQHINSILSSLRTKVQDVRERGVLHDVAKMTEEVNQLQTVTMAAVKKVAARQQQLQKDNSGSKGDN